MEAFESFVALTTKADTEDGRLVVSEMIKFPVTRQTVETSVISSWMLLTRTPGESR
ncbi:hypothetical protein [Kutzneria sp. 744]|uniref:hypothetical protein n=1 Tax=Kutzneria sp. (strain 744) TaxID=345341 RepID=UPI0004B06461|nr:hypothetical protein [Kutzneria sp. 744]